MEDGHDGNGGKKRVRDDWDLDSPGGRRVDSEDSEVSSPDAKRVRSDSDVNSSEINRVDSAESVMNSPEANRIPNDILDILDDPDTMTDPDTAIQDLDSVIKSFEEEILHPSPPQQQQPSAAPVVSLELGESQLDLGYLLEASDDELGLPPTVSPPSDEQTKTKIEPLDLATIAPEAVVLSETLGFEDEFPGYDSFGFGIGDETPYNSEFITVGGLFDYDSADFSEFTCRPESLHAL